MQKLQILSLATLLFIASCGTVKKAAATKADLEATTWRVEQLNGESVKSAPENLTLIFKGGSSINGRATCNLFMGNYTLESDGKIDISPLGMTRTACPEMQLESQYVEALDGATSCSIVDGALILMKDETVVAKFRAVE